MFQSLESDLPRGINFLDIIQAPEDMRTIASTGGVTPLNIMRDT